jgi:hypothetical protein
MMGTKSRAIFMAGAALVALSGQRSACAETPSGVPLYPFHVERGPDYGGDGSLPNDMLESIQHPGVAGAMVLMCWKIEEPRRDVLHFTDGPTRTLVQLARTLKPSQHLIIGMRAGSCAPDWLRDVGVPMPTFYEGSRGGRTEPCRPMTVPVSYDAAYVDRYVSISRRLWQAMATLKLSDGSTLQSHVIALKNAGMAKARSGEFGIYSGGCANNGAVFETPAQAAQTWASLPGPDSFTPEKAVAAYARMLDGLFGIVPPNVVISQAVMKVDKAAFPLAAAARGADDDGKSPILDEIMQGAARKYGNRIVFAWNELSLAGSARRAAAPPENVIDAARLGAGINWQLNGNAHFATSCYGRRDTTPASPQCFADIIAYGVSLVPPQSNGGRPHWIEIWPADATGPQPMF